MSAEMDDCEYRDCWGVPCGPVTRPVAQVRAPLTGNIDQSTDNSTNKPLPWVALACLFGGLGFGGLIIMALLMPQYVRSEVRASNAELRADMAQQFAMLTAETGVAKYEASLAKTIAQRLDEQSKLKR